ncbi:MAG: ribosome maturation factor RimM [Cellulomonadaceae bacterium]|nr:ribosome maturation factor RimM [Cellulomonadaceae bacterium]
MELVVARIGRAHGLAGDVTVEVRTDSPEARLRPGQEFATDPDRGPLTVESARNNKGSWVVRFAQAHDRTAAEALRETLLIVEEDESDEDDAWYTHELVGMRAELSDGTEVGKIVAIEHGAAQDLLVLREPDGTDTLIPFVSQIVPTVDRDGGRIVLTPPGGLLASDAANLEVSEPAG